LALEQKPHEARVATKTIAVRIWQSSHICLIRDFLDEPRIDLMIAIFWIARKLEWNCGRAAGGALFHDGRRVTIGRAASKRCEANDASGLGSEGKSPIFALSRVLVGAELLVALKGPVRYCWIWI
jgi:hypothetical protein